MIIKIKQNLGKMTIFHQKPQILANLFKRNVKLYNQQHLSYKQLNNSISNIKQSEDQFKIVFLSTQFINKQSDLYLKDSFFVAVQYKGNQLQDSFESIKSQENQFFSKMGLRKRNF
ncbi:unnamed protein product [Paramecium sonneborni]|uniref:Uncharacterized protein n=1 Tax=Paramecium sonneborni TaxID=65129 RepID=A0A8S1NVP3_9CILI|nr:unnamed protein product [Paramecium sonneborni]